MTTSAVQLARAASSANAGRFIQDKIKAMQLLIRVSKAAGQAGAARDYERQLKKLQAGV